MSSLNGPSPHLSWKELACKDGTLYPEIFIKDGRISKLAAVFESIRIIFNDKPITVLSAYRTPEYNDRIGGAKYSQHVLGRALDLRPPKGISVQRFYDVIRENTKKIGVNGLGLYPWGVHVDIRPTNKLITWRGNAIKDSGTQT